MKPLSKHLSALFFGLFIACSSVFYTSCGPDDKCHVNVACKNGGVCMDNACVCPSGFEGSDCSFDQRDRFVGTWIQNDNGSSPDDFTISIVADHDAPQVAVTNFDNRAANTIKGFVTDRYTITFNTETVKGKATLTIDGNKIRDKVIMLNYDITDSAGNVKTVMTRLDKK